MSKDKPAVEQRSLTEWLRAMPRWKKIAVVVALGAVVVGGVMHLTSGSPPPMQPSGSASGTSSGLRTSLLEGTPQPGSSSSTAAEPAAQGVFRLGFSFLAGFCIGSFLRATLRIAAIAFGFWLFMTFVLSYMGIVNVDWQAMQSLWDRFAANVAQEWGNFQTFMTGSLPAAGLAATGLVVGLKRH